MMYLMMSFMAFMSLVSLVSLMSLMSLISLMSLMSIMFFMSFISIMTFMSFMSLMSLDVFVGLDVQDVCDDHNVFVVLDVHVGSFGTLWNLEGRLKAFTNEDILSSFEKLVYCHAASYLTVQYRHGAS